MSRISNLNQRYAAIASILKNDVELISVQDPVGARFNNEVVKLLRKIKLEGPGIWDDLASSAQRLRFLLVSEPGPFELNPRLPEALEKMHYQAHLLTGATNDAGLIDALLRSADDLITEVSPTGNELVRSVVESGVENSLVVVVNSRAREALKPWLDEVGIKSFTLGELKQMHVFQDITYFVGPPILFSAHSVTAPFTNEISFVFPSWFRHRRIPQSALAPFSEGAIQLQGKLYEIGAPTETVGILSTTESPDDVEDDFELKPNWGTESLISREPREDEVEARKVLLSGGYGIWLDEDGDRIRALDATKPAGFRVRFVDITEVQQGTYLLLREGASEKDTLQELAFKRLGKLAQPVKDAQSDWKNALQISINTLGTNRIERELKSRGLSAFKQIRSWAMPNTIRPQKDKDFEVLLVWLQKDFSFHLEHANRLRQEVLRASHDLRERLESAADDSDMAMLELNGHMAFDLNEPGYHGMFAARVLAIAPFKSIVSRAEIRLPFKEDAALWLE
jgi:hypothetical protein